MWVCSKCEDRCAAEQMQALARRIDELESVILSVACSPIERRSIGDTHILVRMERDVMKKCLAVSQGQR